MQRAVFPSSGRVFAFQDGGFCRYPSTVRRRQTGRPNARPRTGCITRRTYFLRIIFKVLRLVYIALQSERTSIHSVIGPVVILSLAIKTLAPLHNLASGADYPLDATVCVCTAAQLYA